ncbi:MAG: peptidoglycan DD-metalloendopeptidase family protein [bacterium]|jgi:murein DD-endopeptidase MepM/ murein hydrolase activator NlpD
MISGLQGRKRRISAGLHNLLLGVTRSARRLPRDWRYYALPVLILSFGVTAAYGRTQGINLLDLTGRMLHLQGNLIRPQETDLFSQQLSPPDEVREPEETEPVLPSISAVPPQTEELLTVGLPEEAPAAASVSFASPVEPVAGEIITPFGLTYSETHQDWRFHDGIDYLAPGGTRVHAVFAGRVESVDRTAEFDCTIVLDHGSGLQTVYANCASALVQPGQAVGQNDPVGTVGASGLTEIAAGSHLHFSVRLDGEPVDPSQYLP